MSMFILRNILLVLGATLYLGSLLVGYTVINGLTAHPTSPHVEMGQTIPYEIKGKIVYITQAEKNQTTAIRSGEIGGLVILALFAALTFYRKR
jgi:hypothetical protein